MAYRKIDPKEVQIAQLQDLLEQKNMELESTTERLKCKNGELAVTKASLERLSDEHNKTKAKLGKKNQEIYSIKKKNLLELVEDLLAVLIFVFVVLVSPIYSSYTNRWKETFMFIGLLCLCFMPTEGHFYPFYVAGNAEVLIARLHMSWFCFGICYGLSVVVSFPKIYKGNQKEDKDDL